MSGPSKCRKTYTLLHAATAVAAGLPWMGHATTRSPVLYLNLELQDFAVSDRLHSIVTKLGTQPPAALHVQNLRGTIVTVGDFVQRIGSLVTQTCAGLVVVDPYYKLSSTSGVDENANNEQAMALCAIESACHSVGAAVMIAHHFAKGDAAAKKAIDRAAGAGTLARWPDVVMTLTDHKEPACMTVEFALRNFREIDPFVVRWKHPIWERDDTLNPTDLRRGGRTDDHPAEHALAALPDEGAITLTAWANLVGWSASTLRRKADELRAQDLVRSVGGKWAKSSAN